MRWVESLLSPQLGLPAVLFCLPQKSNVCSSIICSHSALLTHCIAVIDRTAVFVARSANPPQFEDKIREGHRSDPKFSFLNPADPYHAYYRDKMDKVFQGDMVDEATADKAVQDNGEPLAAAVDIGLEPPASVFIMDFPNISAVDL